MCRTGQSCSNGAQRPAPQRGAEQPHHGPETTAGEHEAQVSLESGIAGWNRKLNFELPPLLTCLGVLALLALYLGDLPV